jgi:hypothetical protein
MHDCGYPQQDAQWTDPRFSPGVVQQNYLQNNRFEQAHSHQHYDYDQQPHNYDQSTDVSVLNQQVNVSVDQSAPLVVDEHGRLWMPLAHRWLLYSYKQTQ